MKNRILISIVLPVIAVGMVLTVIAGTFMVSPLISHIQKNLDANLVLITTLGYEKCVLNSTYLQNRDLEENQARLKDQQNETLVQIEILGRQFDNIRLMVVNERGEALGDPVHGRVTPFDSIKSLIEYLEEKK